MDPKRITVYDIARKIGVSHVTVSLALRNDPRISQKRRVQVREAAREMGYRPDPLLASLAAYRRAGNPAKIQSVIAWVNHWEQPQQWRSCLEFDGYWRGASEAAQACGYILDEIRWPSDCPPKDYEQILLARGVRGVLLPPHHKPPDWGDFDWARFSVIRFGMSVRSPDSNLVSADHSRAIIMAVAKIVEYGYRRIGFIVSDEYDQRLGGYFYGGFCSAQWMFHLNPALPPLTTLQKLHQSDPAAALETLREWLLKHKPDAILTAESLIVEMIKELGYRIPQDLAVAGTSVIDLPLDAGINPRPGQIGRIAVEMLVRQMTLNERGVPAAPCRILVESHWQNGKSLPCRGQGRQGRGVERAVHLTGKLNKS